LAATMASGASSKPMRAAGHRVSYGAALVGETCLSRTSAPWPAVTDICRAAGPSPFAATSASPLSTRTWVASRSRETSSTLLRALTMAPRVAIANGSAAPASTRNRTRPRRSVTSGSPLRDPRVSSAPESRMTAVPSFSRTARTEGPKLLMAASARWEPGTTSHTHPSASRTATAARANPARKGRGCDLPSAAARALRGNRSPKAETPSNAA
jgi:hypothetical protein